jgi:hypothetical protein
VQGLSRASQRSSGGDMEEVVFAYKGFLISHLKIPLTTGNFTVNISSENLSYLQKIGVTAKVIVSYESYSHAIADAKRFIDEVLAQP